MCITNILATWMTQKRVSDRCLLLVTLTMFAPALRCWQAGVSLGLTVFSQLWCAQTGVWQPIRLFGSNTARRHRDNIFCQASGEMTVLGPANHLWWSTTVPPTQRNDSVRGGGKSITQTHTPKQTLTTTWKLSSPIHNRATNFTRFNVVLKHNRHTGLL